ncbi:MAG: TonB family protein, partial [Sphingobacteriales bacterium]
FLFILCLLVFDVAFAQKRDTTVYFLNTYGRVVSTKDSADFFLLVLPPDTSVDKNLFVVEEFYRNGKPRLVGNSITNSLNLKFQGSMITYFPNGHRMKIENFEDGDQVGDETEYYPNGKLYCNKTRTVDKKLLCVECRDSTGNVLVENGNGKWRAFIDERFKNYVEGNVSNGFEEGEWYGKRNDTVNTVYQYKNGELKSCADIDKSGQKTYSTLEVVPEFPGGVEAFGRFLARNIRYPATARENGTQGRVIISFIVDKDGSLIDVKVARGIGDGCDDEALRVIRLCLPWKPGYQDGEPVRVAYSVPISFTLGKQR